MVLSGEKRKEKNDGGENENLITGYEKPGVPRIK